MALTPMMQQYFQVKNRYASCIVFFRLGDFYELFFEDALVASKELEIALTGRECGLKEKAPMCGVPAHAVNNYITKLVENGHKVAICDQVEEASEAKGLVKRDVIRVVTPGTILEGVEASKNNYIASIVKLNNNYGLSFCDISTANWVATLVENNEKKVMDEIAKFMPAECLISPELEVSDLTKFLGLQCKALVEVIPEHILDEESAVDKLKSHFDVLALEGIGLKDNCATTFAVASLLNYLKDTQKTSLEHLKRVNIYNVNEFMLLDSSTCRNLELCETLKDKKKKASLLWVLDNTKTSMGARYLRQAVLQPLIDKESIERRLGAVEEILDDVFLQSEIKEALIKIYDIERLATKVSYGACTAKDLVHLKYSLAKLPIIKTLLSETCSEELTSMHEQLDTLEDVFELINNAIIDEPPLSVKDGNFIKEGFNSEVDRLQTIKQQGASWLRDIESEEKEKTGIKNLKIKYNKIFGYFLEVTNSHTELVPDYFIRKQTLSNCERYITQELKEIEEDILGAEEKLIALEYDLFVSIRDEVKLHTHRLLTMSENIAKLDMYASLADVAYKNNYKRPTITDEDKIEIKEGRHPVVEQIIGQHAFIANDTFLDQQLDQISLITGPNMAGKSTYMRQVALIVLMAQIGSFVPADEATIGIVDRIFTRVGASDDLASGQSTFMVEMMEVSNILCSATSKSLLILDEIGRGTSTIDGLSIAQAIIEYIADKNKIGAKTLFATHYHELTDLVSDYECIKNYCVAIKEMGEDIIFLHKIALGSIDHSYGIQVAKLAGLPSKVLQRANELRLKTDTKPTRPVKNVDSQLVSAVKQIDVRNLTPIDAFKALERLQQLAQ
ncbi:MAG: DNA mismatch repair protein MutS [Epulopiscium sp. Nuni2H_MBin001]|nr:MAG: DNA mismatch repair protein MutS [Epulopiscium sp. Nuni2H_MBin001]